MVSANKRLWRLPIARGVRTRTSNLNTEIVVSRVSPIKLLADQPSPIDHILSVYKLKTRPELVRYYHTVSGFPTQPTWIKAIKMVISNHGRS